VVREDRGLAPQVAEMAGPSLVNRHPAFYA